jgi:hypothetical protein
MMFFSSGAEASVEAERTRGKVGAMGKGTVEGTAEGTTGTL